MAFIDFGAYAYRACAVKDPLSIGPWESWYEIYTLDHRNLLYGPTKLSELFATREDAYVAAVAMAENEITQL